jgi:hypothetical protein
MMTEFLATIAGVFVVGLGVLAWGGRLPRRGDWAVSLGIAALFGLAAWGLAETLGSAQPAQAWLRGWIGPREEPGALNVGFIQDAVGLAMAALGALLSGVIVLHAAFAPSEQRAQRIHAAAAISAAGVALAWVALTPWLAFVGITLATLGGFVALGTRWNVVESEATLAARFIRERAWGLTFMALGGCALAGSGVPLAWEPGTAWSAAEGAGTGAALLVTGLLLQLQPFPFLGWSVMASDSPSAARIGFAQVFPGLAAFALLFRLHPLLQSLEALPTIGWISLASAALTTLSGLLQRDWRLSLGLWTSAAFGLAGASLAFAGPWAGLAWLLGAALGALALALLGTALSAGGIPSGAGLKRAAWARAGIVASAAAGTGMIGFVSAGGSLRWLMALAEDPSLAAAAAIATFGVALLGWKTAWQELRLKSSTQAHWAAVVSPLVLAILGLGVVWTGLVSGGAVPGGADRIGETALFDAFFGAWTADPWDAAFYTASWLHWGAALLAALGAWWTTGRKQDSWLRMSEAFPRVTSFVAEGYRVDRLAARAIRALAWTGAAFVRSLDETAWGRWVPSAVAWPVTRLSRAAAAGDERISAALEHVLRRSTDVPAKFLQLVQSGDLQWYLLFAVGSGIAILLHFLRLT